MQDSRSLRWLAARRSYSTTLAFSFFSDACCSMAISAFHLSRMPFITFQNSPRAVRMTTPDRMTLRFAQTAFTVSYSTALLGSTGLFGGKGDGSSGSTSCSEPVSYSDSSPSGSDADEDSIDDGESAADVPLEPTDDGRELDGFEDIFNFLSSGSRDGGQGPVPFSNKRMSTGTECRDRLDIMLTLDQKPSDLIARPPTIVPGNICCLVLAIRLQTLHILTLLTFACCNFEIAITHKSKTSKML